VAVFSICSSCFTTRWQLVKSARELWQMNQGWLEIVWKQWACHPLLQRHYKANKFQQPCNLLGIVTGPLRQILVVVTCSDHLNLLLWVWFCISSVISCPLMYVFLILVFLLFPSGIHLIWWKFIFPFVSFLCYVVNWPRTASFLGLNLFLKKEMNFHGCTKQVGKLSIPSFLLF
jgi:hypothetical protein